MTSSKPSEISVICADVVSAVKAGEHDIAEVIDYIVREAKIILPEIIAAAPAAEIVATTLGHPVISAEVAAAVPAVQAVNTAMQAIK